MTKKSSTKKVEAKKPVVKSPAKKSAAKKAVAKKSSVALPTSRMGDIGPQLEALLKDEPDLTMDDISAVLASLIGASPQEELSGGGSDDRMEAQLLAMDAMEAGSEAQARKLVKRALQLDPDCVDALLMRADLESRTLDELVSARRAAVAAGERSLGEKFIRKNKGSFWMILETRPYMRALQRLAEMLRLNEEVTGLGEGSQKSAAEIYEKMLELNPNDNQGVRDPLLALYLEMGDLKNAGRLLKKYKNDDSTNMAWARPLYLFLSGDTAGASAALQEARRANQHVELYISLQKMMPQEMPDMYEQGSDEDAIQCLSYLSGAWVQNADASRWLMSQLSTEPSAAAKKSAAKRPKARS